MRPHMINAVGRGVGYGHEVSQVINPVSEILRKAALSFPRQLFKLEVWVWVEGKRKRRGENMIYKVKIEKDILRKTTVGGALGGSTRGVQVILACVRRTPWHR